jgi:hypothetical protein
MKRTPFRSTAEPLIAAAFLLLAAGPAQAAEQALPAASQGSPIISYTRVLKGSVPEYLSITVHADGTGTYEGRELKDPPDPRQLKLSAATTRQLFDLAHQLNNFRSIDLESHKRVANLGEKTLTYEEGNEKNRCQFNYTLNRQAQELTDLFERIASVERHVEALQYSMKYDHLGLPRELLQIQIDLNNKALADPQLMVSTLEEIAHNPHFLHLAQARAQDILQQLQNQ